MDKQKQIEEMAKELCPHYDNGNCYYEVTEVYDCNCGCEFCWAVSQVLNAGYRKESDVVKEVLEKVMSFTAEDEVGMKYLIRNLAREYGVEISGKLIKMRAV